MDDARWTVDGGLKAMELECPVCLVKKKVRQTARKQSEIVGYR